MKYTKNCAIFLAHPVYYRYVRQRGVFVSGHGTSAAVRNPRVLVLQVFRNTHSRRYATSRLRSPQSQRARGTCTNDHSKQFTLSSACVQRGRGGQLPPPRNFYAVKNCLKFFYSQNRHPEIPNLGLEPTFWKNSRKTKLNF